MFLAEGVGEAAVVFREAQAAVGKAVAVEQSAAVHFGHDDAGGGVFHAFFVVFGEREYGRAAAAAVFDDEFFGDFHQDVAQVGAFVFGDFDADFFDFVAAGECAGADVGQGAAEADFFETGISAILMSSAVTSAILM